MLIIPVSTVSLCDYQHGLYLVLACQFDSDLVLFYSTLLMCNFQDEIVLLLKQFRNEYVVKMISRLFI